MSEVKPPSRPATSVLVGLIACVPALALGALALIDIDADALIPTAVSIGMTGALVVMGSAFGGLRWSAASNVGLCMLVALGALIVVGLPLFVALEPVWWRFAAGMVGPLCVAAAVAFGAPRASVMSSTTREAVVRWLREPLDLVWRILLSLVGKDPVVRTPAAEKR